MALFDDVLMVSSDEDDDLEILSEKIVPAKSSVELTPDEQKRLLKQLNLDPTASVKIRVSGGGGNQRSLLGGMQGSVARCKVVKEGKVIRQESLQSQKIFGSAKRQPHNAALATKFSEILTISDDEPEESQPSPELSPIRKVTLRKKLKSNQVIDHLVHQQRAEGGSPAVLEPVGCVAQATEEEVSQYEETLEEADITKLVGKSIVLSNSPVTVTEETLTVFTEAATQFETQEPEPAPTRIQPDLPELLNKDISTPVTLTSSQVENIDKEASEHSISDEPVLVHSKSQILTFSESHTNSQELVSQDEAESVNKDESEEEINSEETFTQSEMPKVTQNDGFERATAENEVNRLNHGVDQAVCESSKNKAVSTIEGNKVDLVTSTERQCDVISGLSEETSLTLTCIQDPPVSQGVHEADNTLLPNESLTKVIEVQGAPSEDYLNQENLPLLKHAKSVQVETSPLHGQVINGSPPVSRLNLTAGQLGQLFLPTGQLSQLLPPGTSVHDVMSVCTDLKEDLMWEGWAVSHVSLAATIRVLDKYGDIFEVKKELIVKQELAELEKKSLRMGVGRSFADQRSKEDFLSVMGLCRVEEVNGILEETDRRREVARSRMSLRSGSRRKQSPGEAFGGKRVRAGHLPRNTGKKREKGKGKKRK